MKRANNKTILSGVSTLDSIRKNCKFGMLLLIMTVFSGIVFGGHSTLDVVDPSFNPQLETNSYGGKQVQAIQQLPDGKILVFGWFSSFNRVSTGALVRLNADGSLDETFNNQTITPNDNSSRADIILQADGKIVVRGGIIINGGAPRSLVRLNSDGTLDTSFVYSLGNSVSKITIDSLGRLLLSGTFSTPQGTRQIVRLNQDGSLDTSFNFAFGNLAFLDFIMAQGTKLIVGVGNFRLFRLNENGSEDTSFTPVNTSGVGIEDLAVLPDNKILYLLGSLKRLNADGTIDNTFQTVNLPGNGGRQILVAADGKIVAWLTGIATPTFYRYLPDGAVDSSFTPYSPLAFSNGLGIQSDGKILVGDQRDLNNSTIGVNNFVRLTNEGAIDTGFNTGIGFQNVLPGSVRAITPQADGKVLLGGKFDSINNVSRNKLARLKADSTVDETFQVNTSGTGNYFSILRDIYQIRTQADGKIVVSGWFDYVLNGVAKQNFVRLNSDGSIDPTFNLDYPIPDYSEIVGAGRNRFDILSDNKLMVGNSKLNGFGIAGPVKLNQGGDRDTSFTSSLNTQAVNMFIDDVLIQPDGKILVAGSYISTFSYVSFVARLNADGSLDSSFTYSEEPNRLRAVLALLPDGKILVGKHANGASTGRVARLNSNGTPDDTFNSLSIPSGIINAILPLPNGKIFVGGKFTQTINGQTAKNLLRLGANGAFEPTVYNLNEEVLSLAADAEGRVLIGGVFTRIDAGDGGAVRSFVARLTDSNNNFDYDGDGKADISVFRPADNKWYILQSSNFSVIEKAFAAAGDIATPSDFDGDGKTDLAVFRPSSGDWWYLSSVNNTQVNVRFGQNGDIPRPSDFDGDGKTDFIVYRPSNSVWYRYGTTGQISNIAFGIAEDKPLVGDFDGDGKSDPAVFRPSTGDWWIAPSASTNGQFVAVHWGQSGDIPVTGDFDADGKTDFVVYRPSNGGWYILRTGEQNYTILQFGLAEDKPVSADFDGDGKADIAVWRPSTGTWYLLQTTAGFGAVQWGTGGDVPTQNSFVP